MCTCWMLPSRCSRLDEVIAGVEIAVVLERDRVAARLARRCTSTPARPPTTRAPHRTSGRTPCRRRGVIHSSKIAIRNRPHCSGPTDAVGDRSAILQIERTRIAAPLAPALVRERQHLRGDALDDRNELDELRPQLVAQEPVDLEWWSAFAA